MARDDRNSAYAVSASALTRSPAGKVGRARHCLGSELGNALSMEERRDVTPGDVRNETPQNHEDAHVRNQEQKHPKAERGGEDRRAGVGVVAERVERETDSGRRASRASSLSRRPRIHPRTRSRRDDVATGDDSSLPESVLFGAQAILHSRDDGRSARVASPGRTPTWHPLDPAMATEHLRLERAKLDIDECVAVDLRPRRRIRRPKAPNRTGSGGRCVRTAR